MRSVGATAALGAVVVAALAYGFGSPWSAQVDAMGSSGAPHVDTEATTGDEAPQDITDPTTGGVDGVPRVLEPLQWEPHKPFAAPLAARRPLRPAVLRHAVTDTWRARHWRDDVGGLAARLGTLHSSVYSSTDSPIFGPYYDAARPLARLPTIQRAASYAENDTATAAEVLGVGGGGPGGAAGGVWRYYTGPLPRALEADVQPIGELLRLNPAKASVNLWLGGAGVVAPCHADGYYNSFAQLVGRKRFTLLPPRAWEAVRPFPFLHPSQAQCQAWGQLHEALHRGDGGEGGGDDDARLREALRRDALTVELEPGDVLWLPPLWWHHVEALSPSVSVNAWTAPAEEDVAQALVAVPLPPHLPLPLRRAERDGLREARAREYIRVVLRGIAAARSADAAQDDVDGAVRFIQRVVGARYRDLLDSGALPAADDPAVAGLPLLRAACGAVDDARRRRGSGGGDAQFADEVRRVALMLPEETSEHWLANWVELLAAKLVGSAHAGALLQRIAQC